MLNQFAVEFLTLPVQCLPSHPIPERTVNRAIGVPSRREGPPSKWDTNGISGNVFATRAASSSVLYPQELNQWSSSIALHSSTVEKSEKQKKDQDLRCHSGPSAKMQSSSLEKTL